MQEKEIVLTSSHQQMAIDKIPSVRADLIYDYVTKFKLTEKVDSNFFEDLVRKNLE